MCPSCWAQPAPYDAVVVTAGAPDIPPPLLAQLADRGRMIIPVGSPETQTLMEVEKHRHTILRREITSCVFVPLLGEHGWPTEAGGGAGP